MLSNYNKFRDTLIEAIQNSGLDIGAVMYIFKDVMNLIENTYDIECKREAEAIANAQAEADANQAEADANQANAVEDEVEVEEL